MSDVKTQGGSWVVTQTTEESPLVKKAQQYNFPTQFRAKRTCWWTRTGATLSVQPPAPDETPSRQEIKEKTSSRHGAGLRVTISYHLLSVLRCARVSRTSRSCSEHSAVCESLQEVFVLEKEFEWAVHNKRTSVKQFLFMAELSR